jgi:hypothetical protein
MIPPRANMIVSVLRSAWVVVRCKRGSRRMLGRSASVTSMANCLRLFGPNRSVTATKIATRSGPSIRPCTATMVTPLDAAVNGVYGALVLHYFLLDGSSLDDS